MTRRRLLWIVPAAMLAAAVAYTAWLSWQVQGELRAAESSAAHLKSAWRSQDAAAREEAAAGLADQADAAHDHTDGLWWRAMGHLPVLGDDVTGVAAMSRSLDVIASDALPPLDATLDGLDGLVSDGRIDLDAVAELEGSVRQAHRALVTADDDLAGLDRAGYVDALRTRFDRYADLVHELRAGLASAETAVSVLPKMAGADGPRDYLLIFQNNAEIRATGGLPGSWAVLHAEDGDVEMTRQGTAADFPTASEPVLPLTDEETAVYGEELGIYFHDPGWAADFPRAAELWEAHWSRRFPDTAIDGVIALDPVGMSYLLKGTGPVHVDDVTLTQENAVEELLSRPYIETDEVAQNLFFADAAGSIFEAATRSLRSPVAFIEGLNRAADEGRLLIAAFDEQVGSELAGTQVDGALSSDDGATPHVDIGLNDLTGAKMSYYLRYSAGVDATSCRDGVQELTGTLRLHQTVSQREAAALPDSVTGIGHYGTEPGSQYVMVRVYGPYGGTVDEVRLDGRTLDAVTAHVLNGRPVVSVDVLLSSRKEVVLSWLGSTGPGQTADGQLDTTPSIVPGGGGTVVESAC